MTGVPFVVIGFPCVATWFSGYRQLPGRDIVFLCRDSALFLCRDDVAEEVSLSRSRRPQQEVRCCTFCVVIGLVLVRISLS